MDGVWLLAFHHSDGGVVVIACRTYESARTIFDIKVKELKVVRAGKLGNFDSFTRVKDSGRGLHRKVEAISGYGTPCEENADWTASLHFAVFGASQELA